MAVKENMRKRKHKSTENTDTEDDGEAAVPTKQSKKQKSPKKPKDEEHVLSILEEGVDAVSGEANSDDPKKQSKKQKSPKKPKDKEQVLSTLEEGVDVVNDERNADGAAAAVDELNDTADAQQDSGFEDNTKFSNDFKMLNFRTKLRGADFITELRHFLHVCETKPKMVAKYMEKRGKPLELAEAFERIDKANVLHVAYLAEALQLVLMEIVTNQKGHMESAAHASRYFLKTHGAALNSLLSSTQLRHRCIALKLLTAVVCVEPQLGRQLLSSYDILSNTKEIEKFLSHPDLNLGTSKDTVRKCFIHFVLSFLVDGNVLLIRNILDRPTILHALTMGLIYDDHITVCVVLNTLKKYVLECVDISKTKKIHVFDYACCKHIAQLYDWKGPKGLRNMDKNQDVADEDAEPRDAVAAATHEFLLVLLTSRKHGITFDAITHFRQKYNAIQGKVIGGLYKPWCNERKTELVLKVLTACPDLARHTVRNFAGIVNVMRTPQRDWVQAANFLSAIIGTVHPRLLRGAIDKITLTDFTYWIKDICLPIEALVVLGGSKILRHQNFPFRLATNRLLLAMFTQYANYMSVVRKREHARGGDNAMRRFKFDILNHILVNFPTVDNIVFSLYLTTREVNLPVADILSHLDVALDLILIICRENRSFVNKTNTILDYLNLLRPLYASDDTAGAVANENIKLELKAIKTMLTLYPKALEPSEELFASALGSFIKAFVHGEPAVQREAGEMLRGLFRNTGLFDASEFEIDLWLEPLRYCNDDTISTVTQVFIEVLQVVNADVEMPKSNEMANVSNLRKLFTNIENGFTVQAYIDALSLSKLMPLILKGVELVAPLKKYMDTVCLLIFHYYPQPDVVLQLYRTELSALGDYMTSWLSTSHKTKTLPAFQAAGACVPHLSHIYAHVLSGENDEAVADVFKDAQLPNERLHLVYVQQLMFLVAQLHVKGRLEHAQAARAAAFVGKCLSHVKALEDTRDDGGATDATEEAECSVLDAMLKYVFHLRITYIPSVDLFSAGVDSQVSYIYFLRLLAEACNAYPTFLRHSANYRLKIVKAIALLLHNVGDANAHERDDATPLECVQLIDAFCLQADNCAEVLQLIADAQLQAEHMFVDAATGRCASIYHELIVYVLRRLSALRATVGCGHFVAKVVELYTACANGAAAAEVNLEPLEEALHGFLLIAHQHIPQMSADCFRQFFGERKLSKMSIKLATLLLERDDKLGDVFLQHLAESVAHKELNYPLLSVALKRGIAIDAAQLQSLYQTYKSGFMKTIEKPQKAAAIYREHPDCSIALVQHGMPLSECVDFTKRNLKIDTVELYQMRLINVIYQRAMQSLNAATASAGADPGGSGAGAVHQRTLTFNNFVQLQVQLLGIDLKRKTLNVPKLRLIAHLLQQWWAHATPADGTDVDASKVTQSMHWSNYAKACLKEAMKQEEGRVEDAADGEVDAYRSLLLQLLAFLCDRLYTDSNGAGAEENADAAQLFDMVCTHSRFYDILLAPPRSAGGGGGNECGVKAQLLHLLYVLGKKSPSSLKSLEVPVVLGAYQARLSASDRYALALLHLFEEHNCGLERYRPLIWGESAIAFYALRSADEERARLQQQETSIAQVMSLIDKQLCEYTIDNFPIWRRLATMQQLPEVAFEDADAAACNYGTNKLERRIEAGESVFDEVVLRLCPKRDEIYERCYDPAFFVPLMSMCFAPEAYAHPARPVQNGMLALVFTALSSQDKDMRLAAACVQQRYRSHFEQKKFYERPLWIQTYENLQAGLNDLRESWLKHKGNSGTPRAPLIPCLFVAKTFNVSAEPMHALYKQLTMYLRLKSSFNFQCVPEFNKLFYSEEIDHHAQRQFIVEVIRNGIKCSSDLFLLVNTNIFKVLMGFYGSTMSTLDTNLLILSVFSTCVKIPASTKIIIEHVGVLPWLSSIVSSIEFYHFDIIEGLITIYNNLWYALKANQAKFHNFNYLSSEMHRQLLTLATHLSARINVSLYAKFLNILQKTAGNSHSAMSSAQLDNLISCIEIHYPTLVHSIKNIKEFGGAGAAAHTAYCLDLHEQQVDSTAALALSSLRAYTIDWSQALHQTIAIETS